MHERNSIRHQEFDPSSEDFIDKILSSMPLTWQELTEAADGTHKSSNEINCNAMQFPSNGEFHGVDGSVQALYNVYNGNTQPNGQMFSSAQHLQLPQNGMIQAPSIGQLGGIAKQAKVRARRGQATDPHSIAERLRRERIADRMKSLQELVPNANKTDKASMLEEIIDYMKFLQLQVKVLSTRRLSGPCAITPTPLVDDMPSERTSACNVIQMAPTSTFTNKDSMAITETQVAKLMEEDMGLAMQFLQEKGLCLMPITLATAISTATSQNHIGSSSHRSNSGGSSSPSLSGLTVQSATLSNRNKNAQS